MWPLAAVLVWRQSSTVYTFPPVNPNCLTVSRVHLIGLSAAPSTALDSQVDTRLKARLALVLLFVLLACECVAGKGSSPKAAQTNETPVLQ